jgi:hypothetical protein
MIIFLKHFDGYCIFFFSQEMAKFNSYLRRRQIHQQTWLQQQASQQLCYQTSRSHEMNSREGRPPTHRSGTSHRSTSTNFNSNTIDILIDSPFKDMKGSPIPSSPMSNQTSVVELFDQPVDIFSTESIQKARCKSSLDAEISFQYAVGDCVDGLCILQNGTQRWYPGKISAVDLQRQLYSIQFEDGDIAVDRPTSDIRFSKQRRSRPTNILIQKDSESVDSKTTSVSKYGIGDGVDALCVLPNGTTRWYPCKITAYHRDRNTYDVYFNDGDVAIDKHEEEIRMTKQRVGREAAKVSVPSSLEDIGSATIDQHLAPKVDTQFKTPRNISTNNSSSQESAPPPSLVLSHAKHSKHAQLSTVFSIGQLSISSLQLSDEGDDDEQGKSSELPRVDSNDFEDDDDDGMVFDIPSVFDTNRDQNMLLQHGGEYLSFCCLISRNNY